MAVKIPQAGRTPEMAAVTAALPQVEKVAVAREDTLVPVERVALAAAAVLVVLAAAAEAVVAATAALAAAAVLASLDKGAVVQAAPAPVAAAAVAAAVGLLAPPVRLGFISPDVVATLLATRAALAEFMVAAVVMDQPIRAVHAEALSASYGPATHGHSLQHQ